jgi:hypothetical protein
MALRHSWLVRHGFGLWCIQCDHYTLQRYSICFIYQYKCKILNNILLKSEKSLWKKLVLFIVLTSPQNLGHLKTRDFRQNYPQKVVRHEALEIHG